MSGVGRHGRAGRVRRRRASFVAPPPGRLKRLRVFAALLVVSLGLTVSAAWIVPHVLDWGQYRAAVEAVASAGLGRPVRIAGPIRLSLLPEATLVAGDVTVPDTGDGASATASQLRLRVALGALLAGRIEPQDLALRGARMRLPWPLTALVSSRLVAPAGLHARLEDGTLAIGGLQLTAIAAELRVDTTTGTLSAAGTATTMGRPWQMTGRLGRTGVDGSAPLELSLDGQGSAVGTGGTLSGQIAADGGLVGRITGRGPDLSLLLPAPPQPWQAGGQVKAGSGTVVADDLELIIGGSPAHGALAVRLLPQLRLDVALAASRLDLGAWLPPLLGGRRLALPTGIDLSADNADLLGGTLRRLRTGFEVGPEEVALREADADLPGGATFHLAGRLAAGRFTGDARLGAPNMPQTLAWLHGSVPALVDALPAGAWQTASLAGAVTADANSIAVANLSGDANGAPLAGDVALRRGGRPAVAANLRVAGPVLDRWLPAPPGGAADAAARLVALPGRFAGFDADVTIAATAPVWQGVAFDRLTLEAGCSGGTLDLRRAALAGPGLSLTLAGTLSPAGQIRDGRLDLSMDHAESLTASLPAVLGSAQALFHGPVTLGMVVNGPPAGLALTAASELSDARLQVNGALDLPSRHWKGTVSLRHPGAPRLLFALGLGDTVGWLGDGSLSLQAVLDAAPDRIALAGVDLSAGALRASAALTVAAPFAGHPTVTGTIDAETLPLPAVFPRSNEPWSLARLHAADAKLTLRAAHLLWGLSPMADAAAATLSLADGVVRVDGFTAQVAGGSVAAQWSLADAAPPRFAASGKLTGLALDGPLAGTPVDLVAGQADAAFAVSGTGYSPAGVLATLSGQVRGTVRDGVLAGLDATRVLATLRAAQPIGAVVQAEVAAALGSGTTPFSLLDWDGTVAHGTVTLGQGSVALRTGSIAASGNLDLPDDAIDAHLALQPALDRAPLLGLRLIGPVAALSHSPELADLARWLANR